MVDNQYKNKTSPHLMNTPIKNEAELLSMLALVQNLHISEKERENDHGEVEMEIENFNTNSEYNIQNNDDIDGDDDIIPEPEYEEKIKIFDVLNKGTVNTEQRISTNMSDNNNKNTKNHNDSIDDDLYTFGKDDHRVSAINNNEEGNSNNTDNYESIEKLNDSIRFLFNSKAVNDTKSNNLNNSANNSKNRGNVNNIHVINVYKAVTKFKQLIVDNIILINNFSDNLAIDIQSNADIDFNTVYEKSVNSFIRIRAGFNEISENTEKEFEDIWNVYANGGGDGDNAYNDQPLQMITDAKYNKAKVIGNTNARVNEVFDNSIIDIAKSNGFTNSKTENTNKTNSFTNANEKQLNFSKTKTLIEKITNHYKDKTIEKNTEIQKLKENLKYYEKLIVSSKSLIDEIYSKNKLLQHKLKKYKFIYENSNCSNSGNNSKSGNNSNSKTNLSFINKK